MSRPFSLRGLVHKWGPTIFLILAVGAPIGWALSWTIPIGLFLVGGERRVAAIETDLASIKNRQKEDCQVQRSSIWWMVATSRINHWPEPPGAEVILSNGCFADRAPVSKASPSSGSLFFDSAFADDAGRLPPPP
jgi:hypothetical protein